MSASEIFLGVFGALVGVGFFWCAARCTGQDKRWSVRLCGLHLHHWFLALFVLLVLLACVATGQPGDPLGYAWGIGFCAGALFHGLYFFKDACEFRDAPAFAPVPPPPVV